MSQAVGDTSRWWATSRVHALLCFAVAVVVVLQYGIGDHPVLGDRAYFVYLSQTILRGDSIYAASFMGYPPLAPLLAAAAMWLGQLVDVPTWMAPRYLGVLVAGLNAALAYLLARRASGDAWVGLLAAFALTGFSHYGTYSVRGLEPKIAVVLFSLIACHGLQSRRAWLAGLGAGLAVGCWQPAGLVVVCVAAVALADGRARLLRTALLLAAGGLASLLPSLLYLAAVDGWSDFWQRAFVIAPRIELPQATPSPWRWLSVIWKGYPNELVVFAFAGVGFALYALRGVLGPGFREGSGWLSPRMAAMPLLLPAWALFNTWNFQGAPDMVPILPVIAFFAAWSIHVLVGALSSRAGRWARRTALLAAGVAVTATYAFADAFLYRSNFNLADQRQLVDRILADAGDGAVLTLNADSVHVLAERRAPTPFLRIEFVDFYHLVGLDGCRGLQRWVEEQRPTVIVTRGRKVAANACLDRLERRLPRLGYEGRQHRFSYHAPRAFVRGATSPISWNVYVRLPEGDGSPGQEGRSR